MEGIEISVGIDTEDNLVVVTMSQDERIIQLKTTVDNLELFANQLLEQCKRIKDTNENYGTGMNVEVM